MSDNEADEADQIETRARELARRVMNLPPNPRTKPKTKPTPARGPSSKGEKREPTGEAS